MQHIVISPPGAAEGALQAFVVPDTREAIELAVEAFLARLDALDGDPDLEEEPDREDEPTEANGDELDCGDAEDEPLLGYHTWGGGHRGYGPGCPISDPDYPGDPHD